MPVLHRVPAGGGGHVHVVADDRKQRLDDVGVVPHEPGGVGVVHGRGVARGDPLATVEFRSSEAPRAPAPRGAAISGEYEEFGHLGVGRARVHGSTSISRGKVQERCSAPRLPPAHATLHVGRTLFAVGRRCHLFWVRRSRHDGRVSLKAPSSRQCLSSDQPRSARTPRRRTSTATRQASTGLFCGWFRARKEEEVAIDDKTSSKLLRENGCSKRDLVTRNSHRDYFFYGLRRRDD